MPAAVLLVSCCLLAGSAAVAGCSSSTSDQNPRAAARASQPISTPGPEDSCTRLVSAIGYAELHLRPRGQEAKEAFDDTLRGRIAYVEGTIVQYADRLPKDIREDAEALLPIIRKITRVSQRRSVRIAALKQFREKAAELLVACEGDLTRG
jgi:hypothetical protein